MKKIPTLFVREFENHGIKSISPELTSESLRWVLDGEGIATEKFDGACCAIIDDLFYRRYDAKKGKQPPADAIPCGDPDPITGHWPHWIPVRFDDPAAKWFIEAYKNSMSDDDPTPLKEGTYEAVGPHFQGNPHKLYRDILIKHGEIVLNVPRTFDGIREYLNDHNIEGIVFWKDGEPKCKIKRSDFGFPWGNR